MYEAIIVGGGPAGLAAALTLGRSRRSTLVIDRGEPRNAPAGHMHNFISRDGTPPLEMRRISREELGRYPTVELRDTVATDASILPDGGFEIVLADGGTARGRRLVLATGVIDELPPIQGMRELWGRSVFHCPYCHGYEVRDATLAVLGSSPALVNLAVHLKRFSEDVVLCSNGDTDLDASTMNILSTNGVAVRPDVVGRLEGEDGQLERIVFEQGDALPRQAMFSSSTMRQRSALPEQLGCTLLEDDAVEIDEVGRTSVPGVFAAGDMARRRNGGRMPAVIAAAASGTIAGAMLDKDLLAEDTGLASHVPQATAGRA